MTTDHEHAQRINEDMVDLLSGLPAEDLADQVIEDPTLAVALLGALRHARRELRDFAFHVDLERRKGTLRVTEFDSQSTTLIDLPEPVAARRRTRKSTRKIDVPSMPAMVCDMRSADASVGADLDIEHRPSLIDIGPRSNDAWEAMTVAQQLGQPRYRMPVMFAIAAALIAFGVAAWYLSASHPSSPAPLPAMPLEDLP